MKLIVGRGSLTGSFSQGLDQLGHSLGFAAGILLHRLNYRAPYDRCISKGTDLREVFRS